ncbi:MULTISPECIES: hypothetical protein [Methylobacterium]|uniref:Uncharacterized protein n=1 Tax=Methylobacterium bullatum TaxID=570505 RepID=A0AAV4ZA35_9HYPH|nr:MULTISPECIES: hypothetical protein [Methylobacterium]MBD8904641.1 hypothetical protein [Methylobacterium bullatum]TXN21454.1 hypothetical protein FV220_22970 [Methylobacterium sp. WL19]GJD40908.1 hypothetical protein OICFNHDK_3384 [Methylobacterium bullatum]
MKRLKGLCGRSARVSAPALLALAASAIGGVSPAAADPDLVGPPEETVLAAICGNPARTETGTCRMKDGRTAAFWYGAMIPAATGIWFTGFATMPAPGEDADTPNRRTVAAATFAFEDSRWRLKGVQTEIGRIGTGNRNGDAPQVDEGLGAVTRAVNRVRLVMGLRLTSYGAAGARSFSFLLLQFSKVPLRWSVAGEVPAGSDETAACDTDDGEPCRMGKSEGRLEILPEESFKPLAWPPVRVTLTGTVRGEDGKVRPATDRDARTFAFDEAKGAYR